MNWWKLVQITIRSQWLFHRTRVDKDRSTSQAIWSKRAKTQWMMRITLWEAHRYRKVLKEIRENFNQYENEYKYLLTSKPKFNQLQFDPVWTLIITLRSCLKMKLNSLMMRCRTTQKTTQRVATYFLNSANVIIIKITK